MIERIRPRNRLVEWALARERLRLKKAQGGMPPWSDDPILNQYRFCNVRRRDDKVSKWLLENVLNQQDRFDPWTFIQWTALCRWINWPPTIHDCINVGYVQTGGIGWASVAKQIELRRQNGMKAWTGAYIIRAPSKKGGYAGWNKSKFVTEVVVRDGLAGIKHTLLDTLDGARAEDVYNVLCTIPNWGTFMSGQVVADWTYCDLLSRAGDLFTWAPVGPGSRRGYNRMMNLPLATAAPKPAQWSEQLQEWRSDIVRALGEAIGTDAYINSVTLHDVQNCLCEFDKYERTRLGEGRPRSQYVQETSF